MMIQTLNRFFPRLRLPHDKKWFSIQHNGTNIFLINQGRIRRNDFRQKQNIRKHTLLLSAYFRRLILMYHTAVDKKGISLSQLYDFLSDVAFNCPLQNFYKLQLTMPMPLHRFQPVPVEMLLIVLKRKPICSVLLHLTQRFIRYNVDIFFRQDCDKIPLQPLHHPLLIKFYHILYKQYKSDAI